MATVSTPVCLLLVALLCGAKAQSVTEDCSLLDQAPSDAILVLGESRCFNCTLGTRSPRWDIELDSSFTAIDAGSEPDECDCNINGGGSRLCFENVEVDIAQNYRCQVQEVAGPNLVQCDFQIQLARPPVIANGLQRTHTGNEDSSVTFPLMLSDPGLPVATVEWYKGSTRLTTNDKYTIDEATGSLTITNLEADDRGDYQARVMNVADTVPADYELFVNFAEITDLFATPNGNAVRIECEAIGYPFQTSDLTLTGAGVQKSANVATFETRIIAVEEVNLANCQSEYQCTVNIDTGSTGIVKTRSFSPCGSSTLMITDVREVSATSAVVVWTYSGVGSFNVHVTGAGIDRTESTTGMMLTLSDLVPNSQYTVQVSLSSDSTAFQTRAFITLPCPSSFQEPIRRVSASIVTRGSQRTIQLAWEASSENNVSGYRLYVEPCGSDLDCSVKLSGRDNTSFEYPPSICDGREYAFFIQSINECGGGGPNSSMVQRTCELINQLIGLEARSTTVTIDWDFIDIPTSIEVIATVIGSPSGNQNMRVEYRLESNLAEESACIEGLEAGTTYQVCLEPTFSDSSNPSQYCRTVTTAEDDGSTETLSGCVAPFRVEPAGLVIQNWQIAVIVVGGLAVVAMVFCLVGLCFACQSSKQKVDFGSNSSLNTNYNTSSINGVSMTHQRSMSPARSCLSYHTKGHSTNWNDHVDTLRQMETDTGTNV